MKLDETKLAEAVALARQYADSDRSDTFVSYNAAIDLARALLALAEERERLVGVTAPRVRDFFLRYQSARAVIDGRYGEDPDVDEVNLIARILIAEWERVEHERVNFSRIVTFADMARVIVADRRNLLATAKPDAGRGEG